MVALYRPGPMEQIPNFIRAKHGLEPISYPHPTLEEILKETYGVIVYQEQVLFIVQAFAGYSLGKADIFRQQDAYYWRVVHDRQVDELLVELIDLLISIRYAHPAMVQLEMVLEPDEP